MTKQTKRPMAPNVSVKELTHLDAETILQHLLRLNPYERYLRFGYSISSRSIKQLVAQHLSERGSFFFGVFWDGALVGLCHIARSEPPGTAEVALSVDADFKDQGIAHSLMRHALEQAQRQLYQSLLLSVLCANTAMLKSAAKFGFQIKVKMGQATGHLRIPRSTSDCALAD